MAPGEESRGRKAWNTSYGNLFIPSRQEKEDVSYYTSLRIPEFQRNFVWKTDQLREFVTSVKENEKGYYVGNIVLVRGNEGEGIVVDGQQRLVTLSLICRVLSKHIRAQESIQKAREMYCIEGRETETRIAFSRRILGDTYMALIGDIEIDEANESQKRLIDAFSTINDLISDETEFPDEQSKQNFLDQIIELEFVVIACETDSDAYQLFEGLNSTGLSLAPVELVKNAVLGNIKRIDPTAMREAEDTWEQMERAFESENNVWFGKFLRHQWFGVDGYVNNSDLFKKIREKKIRDQSVENILSYLAQLRADSDIYVSLRKANMTAAENIFPDVSSEITRTEVPKLAYYFKLLGLDQIYSLLLAMVKYTLETPNYARGTEMTDHLRWLLKFSIIARFSKISPASYERIFAKACKDIPGKNLADFRDYMNNLFQQLRELLTEESFSKGFCDNFLNEDEKKGITVFVLSQLTDDPLDFSQFTVEHIIPRGSDWSNWNIDPDDVSLIRESVEKIGNLTLLEKPLHEDTGALSLEDKAGRYEQSLYIPTQQIVQEYGKDFNSRQPITAISNRGRSIAKSFFASL